MRANALRFILRWLWENHGAPKLDHHVRRHPGLRPRNVTVNDDERDRILAAAPPHLRLWLLLCSDLAIRSGTAANIAPEHYDSLTGVLRFTTKYNAHLTLPVTSDIEALIRTCDLRSPVSFVRQLWIRHSPHHPPKAFVRGPHSLDCAFRKFREKLGLRRVTPHDFRRTTAVAMLEHTGDVRDVQALLGHRSLQATIWYLDHDLRPVNRQILEAIKRPRKEKFA